MPPRTPKELVLAEKLVAAAGRAKRSETTKQWISMWVAPFSRTIAPRGVSALGEFAQTRVIEPTVRGPVREFPDSPETLSACARTSAEPKLPK